MTIHTRTRRIQIEDRAEQRNRYGVLKHIMEQAFADARDTKERENPETGEPDSTALTYRDLVEATKERYGQTPAELVGITSYEALARESAFIYRSLAKQQPVVINDVAFPRFVDAGPGGLDNLDTILEVAAMGNVTARMKLEFVLAAYQQRMNDYRNRRNALRHVVQALKKGHRVYRDTETGFWHVDASASASTLPPSTEV